SLTNAECCTNSRSISAELRSGNKWKNLWTKQMPWRLLNGRSSTNLRNDQQRNWRRSVRDWSWSTGTRTSMSFFFRIMDRFGVSFMRSKWNSSWRVRSIVSGCLEREINREKQLRDAMRIQHTLAVNIRRGGLDADSPIQ